MMVIELFVDWLKIKQLIMFEQGQYVNYRALDGNYHRARILYRRIDFENDVIETFNAVGNFDYLIDHEFNDRRFISFCQEEDLIPIIN